MPDDGDGVKDQKSAVAVRLRGRHVLRSLQVRSVAASAADRSGGLTAQRIQLAATLFPAEATFAERLTADMALLDLPLADLWTLPDHGESGDVDALWAQRGAR